MFCYVLDSLMKGMKNVSRYAGVSPVGKEQSPIDTNVLVYSYLIMCVCHLRFYFCFLYLVGNRVQGEKNGRRQGFVVHPRGIRRTIGGGAGKALSPWRGFAG